MHSRAGLPQVAQQTYHHDKLLANNRNNRRRKRSWSQRLVATPAEAQRIPQGLVSPPSVPFPLHPCPKANFLVVRWIAGVYRQSEAVFSPPPALPRSRPPVPDYILSVSLGCGRADADEARPLQLAKNQTKNDNNRNTLLLCLKKSILLHVQSQIWGRDP